MIPDSEVRLTQMTKTAGCAAKIGRELWLEF